MNVVRLKVGVVWVPGTIIDVSVGDLIEVLSTRGYGIGLEGSLFELVVGAILLCVLGGGRCRGMLYSWGMGRKVK